METVDDYQKERKTIDQRGFWQDTFESALAFWNEKSNDIYAKYL